MPPSLTFILHYLLSPKGAAALNPARAFARGLHLSIRLSWEASRKSSGS